jgi:hypothetical protein
MSVLPPKADIGQTTLPIATAITCYDAATVVIDHDATLLLARR